MHRDKQKQHAMADTANEQPISALDLLLITRAYNRKEIPFEEWLKLTREWAERMIKQYGEGS